KTEGERYVAHRMWEAGRVLDGGVPGVDEEELRAFREARAAGLGLSRDVRHGARLRHLRHRTDHGVRQVRRLRQTPRTQGRNLGSVGGGSERVLPAGAKPGDPAARTRRRQGHGAAEKEEVTVQTPGGPAPDLANRSGRYRLLANRT